MAFLTAGALSAGAKSSSFLALTCPQQRYAILPAEPRVRRRPRQLTVATAKHAGSNSGGGEEQQPVAGAQWRRALAAAAAAVLALLSGRIAPAHALRGSGGAMFKMSEKAAEFTLPSERKAAESASRRRSRAAGARDVDGGGGLVGGAKRVAGAALRVSPYVIGGGAVIGGSVFAVRRLKQRQLRRFQSDLQQRSGGTFDEAKARPPASRGRAEKVDTAAMAKAILNKSKTKYKFREKPNNRDRSGQVKLDIFNDDPPPAADPAAPSAQSATPTDSASTAATPPQDAGTGGAFEGAVLKFLDGNFTASEVKLNGSAQSLSDAEAVERLRAVGNHRVTELIDTAVARLRVVLSGASAPPPIDTIEAVVDNAEKIDQLGTLAYSSSVPVEYVGRMLNSEMAAELYRMQAVNAMSKGAMATTPPSSSEAPASLRSLERLQRLLRIDDAKATRMYEEVMQAMLQEAMDQANLDPQTREMMDRLRSSFGDGGTGAAGADAAAGAGAAGGPSSQDDVMRMMQALQQLMAEGGITDEDAREMRTMVKEMGIDVRELVQNAEMLVNVLGPDSKPLIDSLKKLLVDDDTVTDVRGQTVTDVDSHSGSSALPGTS